MPYVVLCYHYVRNKKNNPAFSRIWGNTSDQLREHLAYFSSSYSLMSLEDVRNIYKNDGTTDNNTKSAGLLLTFDDGLSDHYEAALMLSEFGMQGTFFIPTCIFVDSEPANPQIIHFTLAYYGVSGFFSLLDTVLKKEGLENGSLRMLSQRKAKAEVLISEIKKIFKYELPFKVGRKILLGIYREGLQRDFPNIMSDIHLTEEQVRHMLQLGHSIGAHTRTHVSVAASQLSADEFSAEVIEPAEYLEKKFNCHVDAFSYPFGSKKDYLPSAELLGKAHTYSLAFTVEPILNGPTTDPLEIGRIEPWPNDDAPKLHDMIKDAIIRNT